MSADKVVHLADASEAPAPEPAEAEEEQPGAESPPGAASPPPWHDFLQGATDAEIKERFKSEVESLITKHKVSDYCCLAILDTHTSIGGFDLDRIYAALAELGYFPKEELTTYSKICSNLQVHVDSSVGRDRQILPAEDHLHAGWGPDRHEGVREKRQHAGTVSHLLAAGDHGLEELYPHRVSPEPGAHR